MFSGDTSLRVIESECRAPVPNTIKCMTWEHHICLVLQYRTPWVKSGMGGLKCTESECVSVQHWKVCRGFPHRIYSVLFPCILIYLSLLFQSLALFKAGKQWSCVTFPNSPADTQNRRRVSRTLTGLYNLDLSIYVYYYHIFLLRHYFNFK